MSSIAQKDTLYDGVRASIKTTQRSRHDSRVSEGDYGTTQRTKKSKEKSEKEKNTQPGERDSMSLR